jgi:hypothetical protein
VLTSSPNPRYRVQKIYSLQEINYKKKEKEKKKGNINTHEKKKRETKSQRGAPVHGLWTRKKKKRKRSRFERYAFAWVGRWAFLVEALGRACPVAP